MDLHNKEQTIQRPTQQFVLGKKVLGAATILSKRVVNSIALRTNIILFLIYCSTFVVCQESRMLGILKYLSFQSLDFVSLRALAVSKHLALTCGRDYVAH